MKPLYLHEVVKAVNGKLNRQEYENIRINDVSTDSRTIKAGSLYIPIVGIYHNAHKFIGEAMQKGAACTLSSKEIEEDYPVILVEDTKTALLELAGYYRNKFDVKVVGVTGSTGKTTTKDMVASVLSQKYNVLKTIGNYNNEIGLPHTLFNLNDEHEVAVLEMGMNKAGEIYHLSEISKPDYAIITNIGIVHVEHLGSKEAILDAKCEIFAGMPEDGKIYLNGDDSMLQTLRSDELNITFFGLINENDYYATDIEKKGIKGVDFVAHKKPDGDSFPVSVPLPGTHMVYNALAAVALGYEFGLTHDQIKNGVLSFKPSDYRLEIIENKNGIVVISDSYNSNPTSAMASLDVLSCASGRKICVLGDMLELGQMSNQLHFEVGQYAARLDIDLIICVGESARNLYEGVFYEIGHGKSLSKAMYFMDKESIMENIESILEKGDTILIKASRGMKFEEITQMLLG